jgi:peptidoglycan/xylan/chitin deacetylase (PgdA/CDA1 family)
VLAEVKTSKKPKPQRAGHFKAKVKPNSYPQEFLTYAPELKRPEWLAPGVYLTVDDGPSLSNLPRILDSLDGHHAKAMFFFIGVNIITHFTNHPELTRKLLQRVIDSGNLVGYHTMEHALTWPNHIVYWAPDQLADDVELFRMVVKLASERNVDIVYGRAPGGTGTRSNALRDAFLAAGLRSPVGWTAEFRSNAARADVESAAYSIADKEHSSIILMHEYYSTPSVIDMFLTKHRKATEARSKRRGDQDKAASQ